MNDFMSDMCCLMVVMGGLGILLSVAIWVFEFACEHIPAFDAWLDNIIGADYDE